MSYKVGKKTKTRGWQILKSTKGRWTVVTYSDTRTRAKSCVKARETGKHNQFYNG